MPEVTKRKVTMRNKSLSGVDADGGEVYFEQTATDYVLPDEVDAYVADAKSRWASVEVSDEPDAGPGGYGGQTVLMDGTVRAATKEK